MKMVSLLECKIEPGKIEVGIKILAAREDKNAAYGLGFRAEMWTGTAIAETREEVVQPRERGIDTDCCVTGDA